MVGSYLSSLPKPPSSHVPCEETVWGGSFVSSFLWPGMSRANLESSSYYFSLAFNSRETAYSSLNALLAALLRLSSDLLMGCEGFLIDFPLPFCYITLIQ